MKEEDLSTLNELSYNEGMGQLVEEDVVFVAANENAEPIAFIRLIVDDAGVCHVNPIVVNPLWRRQGVGQALTNFALAGYGELRLVSRGSSKAFYEALGFEEASWEKICESIVEECNHCELFEDCNPLPMRKIHLP